MNRSILTSAYVPKTSNSSILISDEVILANGSLTLTLHTAAERYGHFVLIKNIGGDDVTVQATGNETIDGDASLTVSPDRYLALLNNDNAWSVVYLDSPAPLSSDYGYILGGDTASSNASVTTADQMNFSTVVTAALTSADLHLARKSMSGFSDCSLYGYACGGDNTFWKTSMANRLTFATGVTAELWNAKLSQARLEPVGLSDGADYGYTCGGSTATGISDVSTTDRTTFSTGVTAVSTIGNLSQARRAAGSLSNGMSYGYVLGGYRDDTSATVSTTDRIVFATATTAARTVGNLTQVRCMSAGVSDGGANLGDSSVYGYICGGVAAERPTGTTTAWFYATERFTFSTEVSSYSAISNISIPREGVAGMSSGARAGYICGGKGTTGIVGVIDAINFSTSVASSVTTNALSLSRWGSVGFSDGHV